MYNLKIRRRLFGSLIAVAFVIAAMLTLHSGVLDDKIRRKLDRTLRHTENELQQLIEQAEAKARNGRHLDAIAIYLKALDRNPAKQRRQKFFTLKQQIRTGLSQSLVEVGRFKQARAIAQSTVREEPEYWYAHKILGEVLDREGKTEKATEHYVRALQANPSDLETLTALTEILAESGLREELANAYRNYLQSYALGKIQIRCNDALVFERNIVINGSWQRLRIPHPGDGQLRVTCLLNNQPVGIWLGEINSLTSDPMSAVFFEDDRERTTDILTMRMETQPALQPTAQVERNGEAKFLELHLALCKPWTAEMTRKLKRAVIGNPR